MTAAHGQKKKTAKVKGETSGYPSLDLLLDMHAGETCAFRALGQGGAQTAPRAEWQKGLANAHERATEAQPGAVEASHNRAHATRRARAARAKRQR